MQASCSANSPPRFLWVIQSFRGSGVRERESFSSPWEPGSTCFPQGCPILLHRLGAGWNKHLPFPDTESAHSWGHRQLTLYRKAQARPNAGGPDKAEMPPSQLGAGAAIPGGLQRLLWSEKEQSAERNAREGGAAVRCWLSRQVTGGAFQLPRSYSCLTSRQLLNCWLGDWRYPALLPAAVPLVPPACLAPRRRAAAAYTTWLFLCPGYCSENPLASLLRASPVARHLKRAELLWHERPQRARSPPLHPPRSCHTYMAAMHPDPVAVILAVAFHGIVGEIAFGHFIPGVDDHLGSRR